MEVDIYVECTITGQSQEFEYDIEANTLMNFITDLNADTPPSGFSPTEVNAKQDSATANYGITVDGTGYRFIDDKDKTLAELGVKNGSVIVVTEDATVA